MPKDRERKKVTQRQKETTNVIFSGKRVEKASKPENMPALEPVGSKKGVIFFTSLQETWK